MKRIMTIIIVLLLLILIVQNVGFAAGGNKFVVLILNKPIVVINDNLSVIDNNNFEVKPVIRDGRTLLPLRFIAESFGAKVSFDSEKSQVYMEYNNATATFSIGSDEIVINGEKSKLDVPAQIVEGRTLLPLRNLAENVLGKKVYFENDVISIADSEDDLKQFKGNEANALLKKILDVNNLEGFVQLRKPERGDVIATIQTNMGDIKIKLLQKEAPKAVENFIKHSNDEYFNGVIFHRVIKDFMIQGGDPQGSGMGGESIWGKPFEDEFDRKLLNIRGALSMANSGPNTNGSQFFVVQNSNVSEDYIDNMKRAGIGKWIISIYEKYGGTPHLDARHTVFGQVFQGLDVVDKIASVKTNKNDKPLEDVKIVSVKIEYLK